MLARRLFGAETFYIPSEIPSDVFGNVAPGTVSKCLFSRLALTREKGAK